MKFFGMLTIVIFQVVFITGPLADSVSPGSTCHSITPGQAKRMEWRKEGLKNSAIQDYWINCPFERPVGRSQLVVSIRAFNEGPGALELNCNFREMYGGQQRQGGAVSKSINEDDFATLDWTVTPQYSDSIINAACKLPDGIAIEATRIDTGQTSEQAAASPATKVACNRNSINGRWIYTSADEDGDYEIIEANFRSDGTLLAKSITYDFGTVELSGSWSVDAYCAVEAEVSSSLGEFTVYAWLSDNGGAMPGLVLRRSDSYWLAGTFVPYNRW